MSALLDRTTLGLAAVVAVLYFMIYRRTGFFPLGTAGKAFQLMAGILPRMVLGILLGVAVAELLPREIIEGWLSDRSGWRGHAVGWAAGAGGVVGAAAGALVGVAVAAAPHALSTRLAIISTAKSQKTVLVLLNCILSS